MKERPILLNAEMVRAVLEGRKTQTRRIMRIQPSEHFSPMNMALESDYTAHWYTPGMIDKHGYLQPAKKQVFGVAGEDEGYICPFGAVGDRLWVRETWAEAGGSAPELQLYRASYPGHVPCHYENVPTAEQIRWRPSIHMPRWASRITLEITGVRVERLQDITNQDAMAEGIGHLYAYDESQPTPKDATRRFAELWQSIYGEESWQANPWVWVIEFKKLEANHDN